MATDQYTNVHDTWLLGKALPVGQSMVFLSDLHNIKVHNAERSTRYGQSQKRRETRWYVSLRTRVINAYLWFTFILETLPPVIKSLQEGWSLALQNSATVVRNLFFFRIHIYISKII